MPLIENAKVALAPDTLQKRTFFCIAYLSAKTTLPAPSVAASACKFAPSGPDPQSPLSRLRSLPPHQELHTFVIAQYANKQKNKVHRLNA